MREWRGDIWLGLQAPNIDAICITTNGIVKRDGKLVMGAGIAGQARDRFLGIDAAAGALVKQNGNCTQILHTVNETALVALPTKNHWRDPSPLDLVLRSLQQLVVLTDQNGWNRVLLTRPGCGNGGLNWNTLRPRVEAVLDDRFIVVSL